MKLYISFNHSRYPLNPTQLYFFFLPAFWSISMFCGLDASSAAVWTNCILDFWYCSMTATDREGCQKLWISPHHPGESIFWSLTLNDLSVAHGQKKTQVFRSEKAQPKRARNVAGWACCLRWGPWQRDAEKIVCGQDDSLWLCSREASVPLHHQLTRRPRASAWTG